MNTSPGSIATSDMRQMRHDVFAVSALQTDAAAQTTWGLRLGYASVLTGSDRAGAEVSLWIGNPLYRIPDR